MSDIHPWLTRTRARIKRRVVWPLATPIVGSRLWDGILAGYAATISRFGPGGRTDAEPLTLRWIDPTHPIYDGLPETPEWPPVGCVIGGEWDQIDDRFQDRPLPKAISQHFLDNREWAETPLPEHVREQVARFGDAWGYVDDAVARRCRAIEALYESMQAAGYLTQATLADRGLSSTPPPVPVLGEITVDIGRRGQLCWRGNGQHRLAIARVLDIDAVPVLIGRRHTAWQSLRDQIRTAGIDAISEPPTAEIPIREHPDLRDLL